MYTREKRNWIYRRAKEVYEQSQTNLRGMCSALLYVLEIEMNEPFYISVPFLAIMVDRLPEMDEIRPDNKSNLEYWWPKYDRKSRLEAFDKLIKLTEDDIQQMDKGIQAQEESQGN